MVVIADYGLDIFDGNLFDFSVDFLFWDVLQQHTVVVVQLLFYQLRNGIFDVLPREDKLLDIVMRAHLQGQALPGPW